MPEGMFNPNKQGQEDTFLCYPIYLYKESDRQKEKPLIGVLITINRIVLSRDDEISEAKEFPNNVLLDNKGIMNILNVMETY